MKNCNKTPQAAAERKNLTTYHPSLITHFLRNYVCLFSNIFFLFALVSIRVSKGVNVYTFAHFSVNLETVADNKKLLVGTKYMFR